MGNEIAYMLGVVLVGFAVNYALRALPFILFAGHDRQLPLWVTRFGAFISPVIIAALILYSYSGLQWKTAYPYLAGVLTVGLQVWKGNPLVSIVAGTILYMCLLTSGCASQRIITLDAEEPTIVMKVDGVYMGEERVMIVDVIEVLRDNDIPTDRVIHILLDPDVKDLTPSRTLMGCLAKAGYTRPVLVTKRHSEALNVGPAKQKSGGFGRVKPAAEPKKIRYKKADE